MKRILFILLIITMILTKNFSFGYDNNISNIREKLKQNEKIYEICKKILDELNPISLNDSIFIKNAYKLLLKRDILESELKKWVNILGSGTSKLLFIEELILSNEFFMKNNIYGVATTNDLRIMLKPMDDAVCVKRINKNHKFKILSKINDWYEIEVEDENLKGYVKCESVNFNNLDYLIKSNVNNTINNNSNNLKFDLETEVFGSDDINDFKRFYSSEINILNNLFLKLHKMLVISSKYNPYELKTSCIIEGEKLLSDFRNAILNFSKKVNEFNYKSYFKYKISEINLSYEDTYTYNLVKKLNEFQTNLVNIVALRILKDGNSLIKTNVFSYDANNAIVIKEFINECEFRGMKKYALVDILNFGQQYFLKNKEYFLKNGLGEYSNLVEQNRFFVDFTNLNVQKIIFEYLDDITKLKIFDGIIIDRLQFPYYKEHNNDIRTIFIFNDLIIREFEKATNINIGFMSELQEEIFKKFVISKFESFIVLLRNFFSQKKVPFYVVFDAEYYLNKFDTRLCEYKKWANNFDMLILKFNNLSYDIIEKILKDVTYQISRPILIGISRENFKSVNEINNYLDNLKKICIKNHFNIKGILILE